MIVGSFNLNPRSAYLNTESVVLVDSPELAAAISGSIGAFLEPRSSWRALGSGLLSRLPYIDHL
ncbi:MAG TPA: hypothetical protein VIX81_11115 [Gammaproteobacteria bacterium]